MPSTTERASEAANADHTHGMPEASRPGHYGRWYLLLALFAAAMCLTNLTNGPKLGDHDCIVAQAARQVRQSGEWLIPKLGEIPRIRKTPLGIWLVAGSSKLFDGATNPPVTEFSARFPSAVAGMATAFVLAWLGGMMYGRRAGLVAGCIWAGSTAAIMLSRSAQVDMILTFWTTLAFALFWRGAVQEPRSRIAMLAFYVAFALAMMAKAPLPLATVGMALAIYWLFTEPLLQATGPGCGNPKDCMRSALIGSWRQFLRVPSLWIFPGVALFLLIFAAWPAYVLMHVENAARLWKVEYIDMFRGEADDKRQPLLYYIPIVFALVAPFCLSLPEAVAAPFLKRYAGQRRGLAFAFTWAVWGTLFLSVNSAKRYHYLLSVIPAYCLLLAPVIERLFWGTLLAGRGAIRAACWLIAAALAGGAVAVGFYVHRQFPELQHDYVLVAAAVVGCWAAASLAFAANRRKGSFALLSTGTLALLMLGWPAVGKQVNAAPVADALVAGLKANGITPQDEIYIVDSRPDSSVEFYYGYHVHRLIDELEITSFRKKRKELNDDLYAELARRIQQQLARPTPVYLIITARNHALLSKSVDVPERVVFKTDGSLKEFGGSPLVITQAWNGGTATRPAN
jgi:4-amino-4-deoxy-L-arabinose transferase-like glycosyltransferase